QVHALHRLREDLVAVAAGAVGNDRERELVAVVVELQRGPRVLVAALDLQFARIGRRACARRVRARKCDDPRERGGGDEAENELSHGSGSTTKSVRALWEEDTPVARARQHARPGFTELSRTDHSDRLTAGSSFGPFWIVTVI